MILLGQPQSLPCTLTNLLNLSSGTKEKVAENMICIMVLQKQNGVCVIAKKVDFLLYIRRLSVLGVDAMNYTVSYTSQCQSHKRNSVEHKQK